MKLIKLYYCVVGLTLGTVKVLVQSLGTYYFFRRNNQAVFLRISESYKRESGLSIEIFQ